MPLNLIFGTPDDDTLNGTQDRDRIHADSGDDWIILNGGRDTVYGEDGDDSVFGYFGGDDLYGGNGNDELVSSGVAGSGAGVLYGGDGDDALFCGDDPDASYGGAGHDRVTIYENLGGSAEGGDGLDRLILMVLGGGVTSVVVVLTGPAPVAIAGSQSLTFSGFEALTIDTGAGADTVTSGDLDDAINVGSGFNRVMALGGDDLVIYHTGATNVLDGGSGTDTLRLIHFDQPDGLLFSGRGPTGSDGYGSILTGFEIWQIHGGEADDRVSLGKKNDEFLGYGGQDTASGLDGRDWLDGWGQADVLRGGAGNDTLLGGAGRDRLTGGSGADVFVIRSMTEIGDRITDFVSGEDQIRMAKFVDGMKKGELDPALFALDEAVGEAGQFVLRDAVDPRFRDLIWDSNGVSAGGEILVLRIGAGVEMVASDILIN
jgi:Ca2+-binding RTX toxin-like protein